MKFMFYLYGFFHCNVSFFPRKYQCFNILIWLIVLKTFTFTPKAFYRVACKAQFIRSLLSPKWFPGSIPDSVRIWILRDHSTKAASATHYFEINKQSTRIYDKLVSHSFKVKHLYALNFTETRGKGQPYKKLV